MIDGTFTGLVDFAGYPVGAGLAGTLPVPPAGTLIGLLDFVGYSVGGAQVVPAIPAGTFIGLIDFAGYSVGQGVGGIVARGHGSQVGARKILYRMLLAQHLEESRSVLDGQTRLIRENFRHRILQQRVEYEAEQAYQHELVVAATYSILLSEV